MRFSRLQSSLVLLICLSSGAAHANAVLPLFVLVSPGMALSLIPVAVIEAVVLHLRLGVGKSAAGLASLSMNLVTTFIGAPLAYAAAFCLDILAIRAGIDRPQDNLIHRLYTVMLSEPSKIAYGDDLYLLIPTVSMLFLCPFFALSWFVEYQVMRRAKSFAGIDPIKLRWSVGLANITSYALLLLLILAGFASIYRQ